MSNELGLLARQRAGLPTFPGATVEEQLANGMAEAAARLKKYTSTASYSVEQADAVIHKVKSFTDRNAAAIQQYLADSTTNDLPDYLQLQLGKDEVAQFAIASYSLAASGLGPWLSGAVAVKVGTGEVEQPRMIEDADARLAIFGSIVKWDNDGDLATIFAPQQQALGITPIMAGMIIVAVAFVVVGGLALVLHFVNASKVVSKNLDLFDKWCTQAQASGDAATTQKCIETSAGLQQQALDYSNPLSLAIKGVLILGGGYLFLVYGLPELLKLLPKSRRSSEATA